jgi:kynurenine formamidase
MTVNFMLSPVTGLYQQTHIMDSHTGTHLVPPSYALPGPEFNNRDYSPEAQEWLANYEKQYGARGTSQITAEQIPISQTCGWVRVISVGHLMGKIPRSDWPDSAEITVADIQKFESRQGPLNPGEIVIFRSNYSDERCAGKNASKDCMESPLNGQSEGWPAPGPAAILYLDGKGIRCVATDGPSMGGANPRRALMTYWALGSRGMAGLEYLTNLRELPERAYLLFAAPKIRGCHGGVGRAIALF